MNGPCHSLQSPSHCLKCGRRCRPALPYKCKRPYHPFPTNSTHYPALSQNTSHSRPRSNVLIDQLIQVHQIDPEKCPAFKRNVKKQVHPWHSETITTTTSTSSNDKEHQTTEWHRAQQMVYLRENINNSCFRIIQFPSKYVLVKRLEESNHLSQQNRINVNHLYRPFQMQYQTMNQSIEQVIIPLSTFKREKCTTTPIAVSHSSMNNNYAANRIDRPMILLPWLQSRPQTPDVQHWNQQTLKSQQKERLPFHLFLPAHFTQSTEQWINVESIDKTAAFGHIAEESHNDSSSSSTSSTKKQLTIKYTETVEKMKGLLQLLRIHLMKKSRTIQTMTLDSLRSTTSIQTTYSVSSIKPIRSKNKRTDRGKSVSEPLSSNSQATIINVENEILPSDDDEDPFRWHSSDSKVRNQAQNINHNQQNSDSDDDVQATRKLIYSDSVQHMPSSFMFILQVLLLSCFLNRLLIPTDWNCDSMVDFSSLSLPSSISTEAAELKSGTFFYQFFPSIFHTETKR